MRPRALLVAMNALRLVPLLALLLPNLAAASPPALLFEDARGDAGPVAAWGVPVPGLSNGHADLLAASLAPTPEGALLSLRVAALPDALPPDVVWFAGWEASDGRFVGVGYARVVTAEHPAGHEGASWCAFDGGPAEDAEPACEEVAATRRADGFDFALPLAALGDGRLGSPMGAVVRIPDATAWPLFVAHLTGLTLEDYAKGEDAALALPAQQEAPLTTQSARGEAAVPLPWWGALAALAFTARRRGGARASR